MIKNFNKFAITINHGLRFSGLLAIATLGRIQFSFTPNNQIILNNYIVILLIANVL